MQGLQTRSLPALLAFVLASAMAGAEQYVISTHAGGAPPTMPAKAVDAWIGDIRASSAHELAADRAGNIYFTALSCVYKVDRTGED